MPTLSISQLVANTLARSSDLNAWRTALLALLNGGIDSTNLANGAITASKHADLSGSTDTKHSAASSAIADSGSLYTGTNVETALQEIANFVSKGSSGSFTGIAKPVGHDFDSTSALSSSGASWTACSVTVPANTARSALLVELGMQFDGPGVGTFDGFLPLMIKVGAAAAEDMSTSVSRDARFDVVASCINGSTNKHTWRMWIDATTTSGLTTPFDKTKEVILYAGTAWNVGAAGLISNVSMVVEAI